MSKDREGGIGREEITEIKIFGRTVYSKRKEEHFDARKLPEQVRRGLRESRIANEDQPDVLAVIGRAFGEATTHSWADKLSDPIELAWRAPSSPDFDAALRRVKDKIPKGELVVLARKLFGQQDTPPELIGSFERELEIMFERLDDK